MRWSFDMDRKIVISPVPVGRPFRADFDGAFPGLKAWAVLLNRFAVRSESDLSRLQRWRPFN